MTIYLYKNYTIDAWICRYEGASSKQIYSLFGTYDVQTPYTTQKSGAEVKTEISRLNPDDDVQFIQ